MEAVRSEVEESSLQLMLERLQGLEKRKVVFRKISGVRVVFFNNNLKLNDQIQSASSRTVSTEVFISPAKYLRILRDESEESSSEANTNTQCSGAGPRSDPSVYTEEENSFWSSHLLSDKPFEGCVNRYLERDLSLKQRLIIALKKVIRKEYFRIVNAQQLTVKLVHGGSMGGMKLEVGFLVDKRGIRRRPLEGDSEASDISSFDPFLDYYTTSDTDPEIAKTILDRDFRKILTEEYLAHIVEKCKMPEQRGDLTDSDSEISGSLNLMDCPGLSLPSGAPAPRFKLGFVTHGDGTSKSFGIRPLSIRIGTRKKQESSNHNTSNSNDINGLSLHADISLGDCFKSFLNDFG